MPQKAVLSTVQEPLPAQRVRVRVHRYNPFRACEIQPRERFVNVNSFAGPPLPALDPLLRRISIDHHPTPHNRARCVPIDAHLPRTSSPSALASQSLYLASQPCHPATHPPHHPTAPPHTTADKPPIDVN
ncbi:uncharacterized protein H6S33_011065 [Morchella sextelata]|uniref:uncharacterized protein n=1 Tax=Morchella sextelata TaxID=1174677 RepID=UPI001D0506FF|nr:uncharacterized protein H6S33_011065 [Morchella sextelata]KAH0611800.1 hypothetical protein H6S33_011065 [Morchella sextelata]